VIFPETGAFTVKITFFFCYVLIGISGERVLSVYAFSFLLTKNQNLSFVTQTRVATKIVVLAATAYYTHLLFYASNGIVQVDMSYLLLHLGP
jgi:hypothetical protein